MSVRGGSRGGPGERLEILRLRVVLLAYWGTVSVLSRRRDKPSAHGGESVRRRT